MCSPDAHQARLVMSYARLSSTPGRLSPVERFVIIGLRSTLRKARFPGQSGAGRVNGAGDGCNGGAFVLVIMELTVRQFGGRAVMLGKSADSRELDTAE